MTMQPGSDGAVDLNVKVRMVLTDEEFVEQIEENPCLQFIISAIHHLCNSSSVWRPCNTRLRWTHR